MALKMQEHYGDDLAVLLVESQGVDAPTMERFALNKKWLSNERAIWTTEGPFQTGSSGLPNFALLGVRGEILLMGNPISLHAKTEELIDEQLKMVKKGQKDWSKDLKAAWSDFEKGKQAKAMAAVDALSLSDSEDAEEARKLSSHFDTRVRAGLARVGWMLDVAEFEGAKDRIDELAVGLKDSSFAEDVTALAARLEAEATDTEVAAAKDLGKLRRMMSSLGMDHPSVAKNIQKLLEKYPDTKAAGQAARLVELLQG